MGWIHDVQCTLAEFGNCYSNAKVVVSETDNGIVAAVYEVGNNICKIYAVQHVTVTEYRGIDLETAEHLKAGLAGCSKVACRTICGSSWAVVPMLLGEECTAVVSRANDAGGHKLTVTRTTVHQQSTDGTNISCTLGTPVTDGDITVSWAAGTSA